MELVSSLGCKKCSVMLLKVERIRCKQLSGALEAERFARPSVWLPSDGIQFFLSEAAQVAALGQVLSQHAVGVFVDAALPGTMPVGEVHLHPGAFRQFLVCRHFAPLIVRQGQALLCRDPEEHLTEALHDRGGAGIVQLGQHGE